MNAVKETTKWVGTQQPNHTYLIDGDRISAFIRQGTKDPVYFKKPIQISIRGRTFEHVLPNPFKVAQKETRIKVPGSKGNFYFVDPELKTCTCPGFSFRGDCKHVKALI